MNQEQQTNRRSGMLTINWKCMLLLAAIITALGVLLLRQYLFGNRVFMFSDIGSDTMYLYISQYNSIIRHLQHHDLSFWDFENGFGTNLFLYNMTNPLLMAVYLIGAFAGTEVVPYLMVYVYLLELLLAGLAAYLFLSAYRFDERAKLPASLMYAFNGFLLVWGQHYQFGMLCILLPLELLMAERVIRDSRKWKLLVLMTAITVMSSMYGAYMILLFSGLFVLAREAYGKWDGFLRYVRRVLRTACIMFAGVLLAGCSLVPSAMAIMKVSSRLDTGRSLLDRLLQSYPREYYVTLIGRTIATTARGVNLFQGFKNYYEGPCLFFTTLFLFVFVQYGFLLLKGRMTKKERAIHIVVLIGFGSGVLHPYFGVIMNGFVGEFSRYFFLYMIYFAFVTAFTLDRMMRWRQFSFIGALISAAYLFRFSYSLYFSDLDNSKRSIVLLFITGILMGVLLMLLTHRFFDRFALYRRFQSVCYVLLIVLLADNIYVDAWTDFDANSMTELRNSRIAVEKDGDYFKRLYDRDTMDVIAYLEESDPEFYRIEKLFYHGMKRNYEVLLFMDGMTQGYPSISTYNSTMNGNISRFVENYWNSLAYLDENHLSFRADHASENLPQEELTGIKYILAHDDDPAVPGFEEYKRFGTVRILRDVNVRNIASYYDGAVISDGRAEIAYADRDPKADISLVVKGDEGHLEAHVTTEAAGLLFTAIPYEAGWSAEVDGQAAELIQVNEGFSGVALTGGSHTVTYCYLAPGLQAGCLISFVTLLLLIGYAVLNRNNSLRKGENA